MLGRCSFPVPLSRIAPVRVPLALALLLGIVVVTAHPSVARASPNCSNAGPKPSAECATKMEYCKNTSVALVLAVRGRASGMGEAENFSKLSADSTHEVWYQTYREVVRGIVHQIYTKDATYRKLRTRIAPSMALALAALADGCNADPSVTVDTQ